MVVGDVGSGKTMVILASVMMALPYKSILMAPTSLLALQLYEEACKHLPKSVKVALVMQGKDEGEYKDADFIIGSNVSIAGTLEKKDLRNSIQLAARISGLMVYASSHEKLQQCDLKIEQKKGYVPLFL